MNRIRPILIAFVVLASASLAAAQAPAPGTISRVYFNAPKAGHTEAYEQGRKAHMAFHKSAGDRFAYQTYEILNGEDTGGYIIVTGSHQWKDFDGRDDFDAADSADVEKNVAAHVERSDNSFWTFRPEMSRGKETDAPTKYLSVTIFRVRPEAVPDFTAAVKQVNAGIVKTKYPSIPGRWYSLANGGDGPAFALLQPRNSFADFQGPEKDLDAMMVEAYGEQGKAILGTLRKATIGTTSHTMAHRPDLSYVP